MTFKVIYIMVLHRWLSIKLRAPHKAEDLNAFFTLFFNCEVSQNFLLSESIQGEEPSAVYEDQVRVLFARCQLIQVHGIKGSTSMTAERTCQCPCRAALHRLWKMGRDQVRSLAMEDNVTPICLEKKGQPEELQSSQPHFTSLEKSLR